MGRKLAQGIRKNIREEKGRIRREILDLGEQEKQLKELYKKFGVGVDRKTESGKVET